MGLPVRHKIQAALDRQEKECGDSADLQMVRAWLAACSGGNEFLSGVRIEWIRYGKLSYECYKRYYMAGHMKAFIESIKQQQHV